MTETMHYDEMEDRLIIKRTEDLTPVVEDVKAMRESPRYVEGMGYLAARVPLIIIELYAKARGIAFQDALDNHMLDILRSPEYSAFRVWQGKV